MLRRMPTPAYPPRHVRPPVPHCHAAPRRSTLSLPESWLWSGGASRPATRYSPRCPGPVPPHLARIGAAKAGIAPPTPPNPPASTSAERFPPDAQGPRPRAAELLTELELACRSLPL